MSQDLHFKTNVLLKSIIGKDLINDDNIAVLELVKNAFDAGSPIVNVIFNNIKSNDDNQNKTYGKNSSKIIIQDFGKGMNGKDIENKWLNIAYSEKKDKKEEHNRILAGNKGVGRFSCDRLGQFLDIYTKTKNDNLYFHLKINWNDFETEKRKDLNEKQKEELEIQKIKVSLFEINEKQFESISGYKPFKEGLILEISKLRREWAKKEKKKNEEFWNVDKLLKLRNYLEKLLNPNQTFQKSTFATNLIAKEFIKDNKHVNGKIENKIFNKLEFTATSIDSIIDPDGETILTTIIDKGRIIFRLKEKNIQFKLLKDVRVFLYYLNTYSKIYFSKQTGIRSVDFGSVFLFINGFMIPPYGETDNDWLGLEVRKGQGHMRFISTRELVGRIEIKDSNNRFKIVSSREGVVNDEPFIQLTEASDNKKNKKDGFFYYTFKRLEKYVVDGLRWDKVTGDEDLEEAETLSQKRAQIIKDFENKTKTKTAKEAEKFETYYETEIDKKKRVFSLIQNIINVKKENIIDLYINEDLIVELVQEEEKEARNSIQKLLKEIDTIEYSNIELELEKIEANRKSLNNVFNDIQSVSDSSKDKKTLAAIKDTQALHDKFEKTYSAFIQSVKKLAIEKKLAEEKAQKEKEEKEQKEAELEAEKQKNTYLLATRRTLSEDADGLVHTIKINNTEIRDGIDNLLDDVIAKSYTEQDLIKRLGNIRVNAERTLKLAEIATRSNFKSDIEKRDIDIVKYFMQYLQIYKETFNKGNIIFEYSENNSKLVKNLSVLNLSIIIDNIISNSINWGAKKVKLIFKNINLNTLSLVISDNGVGLSKKFIKVPEKIFELGVGDISPKGVSGSGIGLYYTRELLSEMNATINFIGNGKSLGGASFEIVFKKSINR